MEAKMLRSLELPFAKYVNKVVTEFSNAAIADAFEFYSSLMGIDGVERKSRKTKTFLKKCLERQLVFIQYCATCKLLQSDTKANLEATKKWVSLQKIPDVTKIKNIPVYEIFFYLSNGCKVFAFSDNLSEIDFADIYSATFFEGISVSNRTWPYLTKANLKKTLKTIHDDMAFDQYEIKFGIPEEYAPSRNNAFVFAQCEVEGMPSIDKLVKIRKTNELFDIDLLKTFKL